MFLPLAGNAADPLPPPGGRIILTVSGNIGVTNSDNSANFDRQLLKDIGWRELDSYTDWTEGVQHFAGVSLQDVLERIDANGDTLEAIALNDYRVTIPASDAKKYDVLLALDNSGKPMSVRDKGPIWIIYPSETSQSDEPKPNNEKMVWQLRSLIVK